MNIIKRLWLTLANLLWILIGITFIIPILLYIIFGLDWLDADNFELFFYPFGKPK